MSVNPSSPEAALLFSPKSSGFCPLSRIDPFFLQFTRKLLLREYHADARNFVPGAPFPVRKQPARFLISGQTEENHLTERCAGPWHELGW